MRTVDDLPVYHRRVLVRLDLNVPMTDGTIKDDAQRGAFAGQLASLADVYVDDAFACLHRRPAALGRLGR